MTLKPEARPWTFQEEMTCIKLARSRHSPLGIGKRLGERSSGSIIARLKILMSPDEFSQYMGKPKPIPVEPDREWTPVDYRKLIEMQDRGLDTAAMCAEFEVPSSQIQRALRDAPFGVDEPTRSVETPEIPTTERPKRDKCQWSSNEMETLMVLYRNRTGIEEMALVLKRTPNGIRHHLQKKLSVSEYRAYIQEVGGRVRQDFSAEDRSNLLKWADECVPALEIANRLGRVNGVSSVIAELRKQRGKEYVDTYRTCSGEVVSKNRRKGHRLDRWSKDEDSKLVQLFRQEESHAAIAKAIGRTESSVTNRCARLGLRRRAVSETTR
jgi:hypothetical protein